MYLGQLDTPSLPKDECIVSSSKRLAMRERIEMKRSNYDYLKKSPGSTIFSGDIHGNVNSKTDLILYSVTRRMEQNAQGEAVD